MAPFVGTPPDSSVDINMKSLALEKARPEATLDFYGTVLRDHQKLKQTLASGGKVSADGNSLTPIELVGVARWHVKAERNQDPAVTKVVQDAVDMLDQHLEEGHKVYGVNTGFGGSADTRTENLIALQKALTQMQNAAILVPSDMGKSSVGLEHVRSHALPLDVVKGAMLARANSLLRGHSAVRVEVIDNIFKLLENDMIPIIPLRGSISASGDLTPLSYIAGAIEGNSDIYLQCGPNHDNKIVPASEGLRMLNMEPVVLGPKEGLGLLNGTAICCSAATLALHESEGLALLAQLLTGMATEALRGTAENYHPFIAEIRPHPGQIEAAHVIKSSLEGSRLARSKDTKGEEGLYQDRYALRTASQWIGPQLEDLALARKQLSTELNSTTDNPLIDAKENLIHHGGNFQAASVTSAMEKTRLSLQMIGKLIFSQSSEIINPMLNGILSPNLCFDDPSLSFTFKGVDINMASYMSELAFLANPVSSHVQSAEMHNQALNSLALISARYTQEAVEITSLMTAAHLYLLCQAMDLQVLHSEYFKALDAVLDDLWQTTFAPAFPSDPSKAGRLHGLILSAWIKFKTVDLHERCEIAAKEAVNTFLSENLVGNQGCSETTLIFAARAWSAAAPSLLETKYQEVREPFAQGNTTTTLSYLGTGSAKLYKYVRHELNLPLFKGLVEHPTHSGTARGLSVSKAEQKTLGSRIGTVYAALRAGRLYDAIL